MKIKKPKNPFKNPYKTVRSVGHVVEPDAIKELKRKNRKLRNQIEILKAEANYLKQQLDHVRGMEG